MEAAAMKSFTEFEELGRQKQKKRELALCGAAPDSVPRFRLLQYVCNIADAWIPEYLYV